MFPEKLPAGAPDDFAKWSASAGATQIATSYVIRDPLHDWLGEAAPALAPRGISLCGWQRDWDRAIWPHATAGFFKVKQHIPQLLATLVAG